MLNVHFTSQFKKDVKACQKRGFNIQRLQTVMQILENEEKLPAVYLDHSLKGNKKGFRDCHIAPDWILLYQIKEDTIIFTRTGSHNELFNK